MDEARNFAPEDFSDINCKSVWITEKSKAEQGFLYELIFVLQNSGDLEIEKTISTISQHKIVKSAQRNEKFADRQSSISLNKSIVYLETGHTADISIERVDLIEKSTQNIGITFTIDPEIYNADTFEKTVFWNMVFLNFGLILKKGKNIN